MESRASFRWVHLPMQIGLWIAIVSGLFEVTDNRACIGAVLLGWTRLADYSGTPRTRSAGGLMPPLPGAWFSWFAVTPRFASGCWPTPPPPPGSRTAGGLWPGTASSRDREIARRCDPRCQLEIVAPS